MNATEGEELPEMFTESVPTPQDVWAALRANPHLEEDCVAASCELVYPAGVMLRFPVEALLRAILLFARSAIMWPFTRGEGKSGGCDREEGDEETGIKNNVPARAAAALYLAAKTVSGCSAELAASPHFVCLAVGHLCEGSKLGGSNDSSSVDSNSSSSNSSSNGGCCSSSGSPLTTRNRRGYWAPPTSSTVLQAEPRLLAVLGYDVGAGRASAVSLAVAYCAMIGLAESGQSGADKRQETAAGTPALAGRAVGRVLEAAAGSLWAAGVHLAPTLACAAIESVVREQGGAAAGLRGPGSGAVGGGRGGAAGAGWWRVFDVRDEDLEHCGGHVAAARARVGRCRVDVEG